jgi:hypothetical protein
VRRSGGTPHSARALPREGPRSRAGYARQAALSRKSDLNCDVLRREFAYGTTIIASPERIQGVVHVAKPRR